MERQDVKRLVSIIANGLIVILVVVYFSLSLTSTVVGSMMGAGWGLLKYYTSLSNLFAGIAAAILLPYEIISFIKKQDMVPLWALLIKFVFAVALMLTFLISAVYLGPVYAMNGGSYLMMFEGLTIIVHLIVPVIAFVSFCFFENFKEIKFRYSFLGLSTVILYSIFYIINYYFHLVPGDGVSVESQYDWYSFFQSESPLYVIIAIIIILSLTYGISFSIWIINKKTGIKKNASQL